MNQRNSGAGQDLTDAAAIGHASMIECIGVFARLPGGFSGERPGVAWRISPLPIPYLNLVMARGLVNAEVDAGIEALAEHASGRPTMLFLGPFPPERLAEVITHARAKGLVHHENERLMTMAVADLAPAETRLPARPITVAAVETRADAETWSRVCAAAFDISLERFPLLTEAMADPNSALRQYAVCLTARVDGVPAATAVVTKGAGLGGIYAVGTAPTLRRRGAATAMMRAAAYVVEGWGCTHVALQATAAGLPFYERLGFSSHGDYAILMTS